MGKAGFSLKTVQSAMKGADLEGWLFYFFQANDPIAARILDLPEEKWFTRRWFYFVPRRGAPKKIVHRVEPGSLDHLPGKIVAYGSQEELRSALVRVLGKGSRVAMQYSPRAAVPSISRVDAGTLELIRSLGVNVVSSGDLVAAMESSLSPAQADSHVRAARALHSIVGKAFSFIARSGRTDESLVQRFILEEFRRRGLVTSAPPIVAADKNSAFPHYATPRSGGKKIGPGSWVLLDLWAKEDRPGAIYADITWCGFVGERVPEKYERIFKIVRDARQRALSLVESRFHKGRPLKGWEVDRAARGFISSAGYGRFFLHRTGHSIGTEDHANGANMDSLETFETRRVLANTVFSIEPGIYLKDFGVRSEINVWLDGFSPTVTGGLSQETVFPITAGERIQAGKRPG